MYRWINIMVESWRTCTDQAYRNDGLTLTSSRVEVQHNAIWDQCSSPSIAQSSCETNGVDWCGWFSQFVQRQASVPVQSKCPLRHVDYRGGSRRGRGGRAPPPREKKRLSTLTQWFSVAPFAHKGRWRNFHVFGALSLGLNFNIFWNFFAQFFCYAVSSCVYDHSHPYLVSECYFLAENKAFPYPRRLRAHPRRLRAILWGAAATCSVVIFVVVVEKKRSPNLRVSIDSRSSSVTLDGHFSVIF